MEIIELNNDNILNHSLCTLKNIKHDGYRMKTEWLKEQFKLGLKVKILHSEKDSDVGMIEYIPGKFSWRAVKAENYMFIHCLFIAKKAYQKMGYGGLLIDQCIQEAKDLNMHGVAVVTSKSAFLAERDIFLKADFKLVDSAPPAYDLLVLKFGNFPDPSFPEELNSRMDNFNKGLTIFITKQCPFIAKAAKEINQTCLEKGIKPNFIEINSFQQAQSSPVAYGCFGIIWDGEIVADHPISNGRFKNIVNKKLKPTFK